ncbi:unnamed protein product [Pleuronectes platessa]|uniref:Uncharacterized protein n=1 Tax=Pleuronectes platessa TaxID=8262 RepID=A0A9N7UIS1_PLEPL|nr:unnamed protein product [Pleuronectes platessa]
MFARKRKGCKLADTYTMLANQIPPDTAPSLASYTERSRVRRRFRVERSDDNNSRNDRNVSQALRRRELRGKPGGLTIKYGAQGDTSRPELPQPNASGSRGGSTWNCAPGETPPSAQQDDVRRKMMCAAGEVRRRRCAKQDEMCAAGDVCWRTSVPQEMCAAGDVQQDVRRRMRCAPQDICAAGDLRCRRCAPQDVLCRIKAAQ